MQTYPISDISILIAEDERDLLDSMSEYLNLFFKTVHKAKDGAEAYRTYLKHHPDIIIADINMPRLDGLSMIEKIRENDLSTKIIITSAHSDKEKLMQAIELHLVKYLIKPVQSDTLKTLLFSLVDALRCGKHMIDLGESFQWDKQKKRMLYKGEEAVINPKEQKVLELFFSHPNQAVSVLDIFNSFNEDQPNKDFSSYAVTSLMKRLRQKLPKGTIKNSYGVGYILHLKNHFDKV